MTFVTILNYKSAEIFRWLEVTESIKPSQVSTVQKIFFSSSRVEWHCRPNTGYTHFYLPRTNIYCAICFAVFVHEPLCNCLLPRKLQEITKYNLYNDKIGGREKITKLESNDDRSTRCYEIRIRYENLGTLVTNWGLISFAAAEYSNRKVQTRKKQACCNCRVKRVSASNQSFKNDRPQALYRSLCFITKWMDGEKVVNV